MEDAIIATPMPDDEMLAVNAALRRPEKEDALGVEIVSLRFLTGLSWPDIAELTDSSERELKRCFLSQIARRMWGCAMKHW